MKTYTEYSNINIKITNMFGQIVYLTNIDQQTTTIDLSKIIGKGFYTIQSFFTSGVQIGLQKLIIK